jgi:hypothetical protein
MELERWAGFLNVEKGGQGLNVRVSDPFLQSCFVGLKIQLQ